MGGEVSGWKAERHGNAMAIAMLLVDRRPMAIAVGVFN